MPSLYSERGLEKFIIESAAMALFFSWQRLRTLKWYLRFDAGTVSVRVPKVVYQIKWLNVFVK